MAYNIVSMYIPSSKYGKKCPYSMTPQYITVHNTANDAAARNEASYMRNNNSSTSFHVVIDDNEVVLCAPFNRNCFHAGDGSRGTGNRKSIGIEICYSRSGGSRFDAAERNAAVYIASLLKTYGWGIDRVKRHKDWSGKNCPHRTMANGWQRFLNMVAAAMGSAVSISTGSSGINAAATGEVAEDGKWGPATTRLTQRILNTVQDGIVSGQLTSCMKYLPNALTSSWKFAKRGKGSPMVRALQRLVGAEDDGKMGKQTVIAMQCFLNAHGFDCGREDGVLGYKTAIAWQCYINSRL